MKERPRLSPAAWAALDAPLAARNDVLTVIPATLSARDIETRITGADAVALIKVGRHFAKVREILESLGLAAQAHYVQHATMDRQAVLPLDAVDPEAVPYFSMILVHRRGQAWR